MPRFGLIVTLLVACGGAQKHADVGTASEPKLLPIKIEGNTAIDTDDLVGGLALQRNVGTTHGVDPFQLTNDNERIKGAFLRLGFFSVDVQVHVDHPKPDEIQVTFHVVEGPRAKLAHVDFPNLPPDIPPAKARELVKLADGAPFDYEPYDDAKDALQRLLQDSGYAHARVGGQVNADRGNNQATIEYTVDDASAKCVFGETTIQGIGPGALAGAIALRQGFRKGDPYNVTVLEKMQRALYGLGRFSTVRVVADLSDPNATTIPVNVVVTEANRHEFRIGGGFGLDAVNFSPRLRSLYSQAGVFDQLTTFSVEGLVSPTIERDNYAINPLFKLIVRLARTDLAGLPDLKGELEGGFDFFTVEAYTAAGLRARAGLSTPLFGNPKLQARIGWTLAGFTFSGINAAIQPPTPMGQTCMGTVDALRLGLLNADCSTQTERLGYFSQGITLDLRDDPIEPRKGFYASMQVSEGTRYALGDYAYIKLEPELRSYVPLGPVVLAGRVHLARIDGDVPVTERLYGGGGTSDRGFDERRLSPISSKAISNSDGTTTVQSVVIGGAALFEAGVEVRLSLGEPFNLLPVGIVGFLDTGDVTESPSELDFANLHVAAGGGLRIFLPFGAVRFDIGYRLNRFGAEEPQPNDRLHYFFSFGEAY